jgi:hypothetical protein
MSVGRRGCGRKARDEHMWLTRARSMSGSPTMPPSNRSIGRSTMPCGG